MSNTNLIQGRTGPWEIVLGLEVHAQVVSKAKLFSGAATEFGAAPNTQVSFVDAAFPGMLPVLNKKCVEQAVRTGLGLKAEINLRSVFDRKNYFYPDLPPGYQISQYTQPIVGKGVVQLDMQDGTTRRVGITRLHLEQDAGKSLHDQAPGETYVDLNRAGVALMEIVSEPDLRSGEEAAAYLRKLRSILRYLGTCDGNMEEGSMRCDVNLSVRKAGGTELGTRCEIKNVNSVRFVMQAIEYEARRQIEVLEEGGRIVQETRLFDSAKGVTRSMRSKEEAHDYRYFPDPDLLPLELDAEWVEEIRNTLPELPDDKQARFMRDFSLSHEQATVLVADRAIAEAAEQKLREKTERPYFRALPPSSREASFSATASMITTSVFAYASEHKQNAAEWIRKLDLVGLQELQDTNVISGRLAKEVFDLMVETDKPAAAIVAEKGLRQVTDTAAIEAEIDAVLSAAPDKVAEYRAGKDKLFGFFVGQVMKRTQGKANPAAVNELLKRKLRG